jgi:hypothetical protein
MQESATPETPEQRKVRRLKILLSILFLVGAFATMILGMVGKVYYDHITKETVFSLSQIALPLIVAPMVYGGIYAALRSSTDVIPALILSFQNGFFWQDVFAGIKPPPKTAEILPTLFSSLF